MSSMPFHNRSATPTHPISSLFYNYLPLTLAAASISIPLLYTHVYEKFWKYEGLGRKVRADLQSEDSMVRESAVNKLLNDLATEKQTKKNEAHYREHAAAAYDFGFFDILYRQITGRQGDQQSEQFIHDALQCMRKMIKSESHSEHEKRHQILQKYGIKEFFNLTIQEHAFHGVTESSLALLRSLTRFDRFRRWTLDDVPNGSQGCVLLQYIPDEDWRSFLEQHLSTNDVTVLKHATSVIAHATEYAPTARVLNKCDAVSQLINHLNAVDKLVETKSLIAISKIFEIDPAKHQSYLLRPKVISDILRLASPRERVFNHPPDDITEHSIMLILYTMARRLLVDGTKKDREEFNRYLWQNAKQMATIFMLIASTKQSTAAQIREFNEMIESPDWCDNNAALLKVRHAAEQEMQNAFLAYKRMQQQRHQQMQMQGMGGMGGMGMPMMR